MKKDTKANRQWLEDWVDVQNAAELVERKEYYDYLVEDEGLDESFEEWNSDMSVVSINDDQATPDEIAKLAEMSQREFPQQLVDFWQEVGKFGGEAHMGEIIIDLPSTKNFLYNFSDESPRYEKLIGLGLINMMNLVWGNNKSFLNMEPGHLVKNGDGSHSTQEELVAVNSQFTCFGSITDGSCEGHLFLHYQQQGDENEQLGKFGASYWHQDDKVPLTPLIGDFDSPEALVVQCIKGFDEILAEDEEDPFCDMKLLSEWLVK